MHKLPGHDGDETNCLDMSRPCAGERAVGWFVSVLALVAGGVALTSAPAAQATVWKLPAADTALDPLSHLTEYENRLLIHVNKRRVNAGLKPVKYFASCPDRLSERWARHLVDLDELVHRDQHVVLRRCNYSWAGETIVRGTDLSPGAAVRAWMASSPHRAVLMKPRANRAGIGVRLDGLGRVVGVLDFGDSR